MKNQSEVKELFISNAIHLIAEGGFEKATTKELTHYSGDLPDLKMNEVYIYRIFGSKENLYEAVFVQLDIELFTGFRRGIKSIGGFDGDIDIKESFRKLFVMAWEYIMKNEERCRCYVRYYYSVYFRGASLASHKMQVAEIVDEMRPIFKNDADVTSILHCVFTTLFDFAIRVYNRELEDNEENRPHIFNVLYRMMAIYFKN